MNQIILKKRVFSRRLSGSFPKTDASFFLSSDDDQRWGYFFISTRFSSCLQSFAIKSRRRGRNLKWAGTSFFGIIERIDPKKTVVSIRSEEFAKLVKIQIQIFCSVLKPSPMDWLIQKATELGVYSIHPVIYERTVFRSDDKGWDSKLRRWGLIAQESIKQCGGLWLPKINSPLDFDQIIQKVNSGAECGLNLVAALDARQIFIGPEVESYLRSLTGREKDFVFLNLWIGPEGDFSPSELEVYSDLNFQKVTLGNQVLRAETASIVGAACMVQARDIFLKREA